jgi:peptidoglycan/xylan/chitin deacetylase (PgdA/CDA1 family)
VTLALLTSLTAAAGAQPDRFQRSEGGIVRGSTETRQLALVFTGHEFAEGATAILDELARRRVKASFFLTGTFLRDRGKAPLVTRMVRDGHYVGPHSDAHLLYAPWTGPKATLVSRAEFVADLERNIDALRPFGVARERARFFLPSYEWYTEEVAAWTHEAGLTLVCHTPGTRSNADYTEEGTPQFVPTDVIFDSILRREREDPHGLNGFLLLLHVGAGPGRTDKFHRRFGELVDTLAARGYTFARVDELLQTRLARHTPAIAGAVDSSRGRAAACTIPIAVRLTRSCTELPY